MPIGCVRFTRYCGKMNSRHLFSYRRLKSALLTTYNLKGLAWYLTPTNLYLQVLFLILHFLMFTKQDDPCVPATIKQASAQLNKTGGGPLGNFNKNYMAFTRRQVQNNFKNLITQKQGKLSAVANSSLASLFPVSSLIGSCTSSQSNFPYCSACPVVTDLGPGKFPRFINEVICQGPPSPPNPPQICGLTTIGICMTTSINQQLLEARCDPATNTQILVPYTQPIRSCCECFLLWLDTSSVWPFKWKLLSSTFMWCWVFFPYFAKWNLRFFFNFASERVKFATSLAFPKALRVAH